MARALQLVVELKLDAKPISGRISTDSQPGRPFHGWLELATAIETLRNVAMSRPNNPPARRMQEE